MNMDQICGFLIDVTKTTFIYHRLAPLDKCIDGVDLSSAWRKVGLQKQTSAPNFFGKKQDQILIANNCKKMVPPFSSKIKYPLLFPDTSKYPKQ